MTAVGAKSRSRSVVWSIFFLSLCLFLIGSRWLQISPIVSLVITDSVEICRFGSADRVLVEKFQTEPTGFPNVEKELLGWQDGEINQNNALYLLLIISYNHMTDLRSLVTLKYWKRDLVPICLIFLALLLTAKASKNNKLEIRDGKNNAQSHQSKFSSSRQTADRVGGWEGGVNVSIL